MEDFMLKQPWERKLELNLRMAIKDIMDKMADEGTDFPWMCRNIRDQMAASAVAVLAAVGNYEQWLISQGGLDQDWVP
jgi:hypothetical protein